MKASIVVWPSQYSRLLSVSVFMSYAVESIDVNGLLAFLEYLTHNEISVNKSANYLAAIKAKFTVLGLNGSILDDKKLKYYLRSLKLNRPVCPLKISYL